MKKMILKMKIIFIKHKMSLSRKDILLITNKETAFREIAMKTDWDNHRKAAERSSWKKKHEPDKITKCPNRGKRYKKKDDQVVNDPPPPQSQPPTPPAPPAFIIEDDDDELCDQCKKPSEGYDFPCKHPICHPCFIKLFNENEGHVVCQVCMKEYDFEDNLVDEND
jgi:hypothetical protein